MQSISGFHRFPTPTSTTGRRGATCAQSGKPPAKRPPAQRRGPVKMAEHRRLQPEGSDYSRRRVADDDQTGSGEPTADEPEATSEKAEPEAPDPLESAKQEAQRFKDQLL